MESKNKATFRIPTKEPYGFIEVEFETNDSTETLLESYDALVGGYKAQGEGLDTKRWNDALDRYLEENRMDSNVYLAMSKDQQGICQEIKKSIKRIEAKKQRNENIESN